MIIWNGRPGEALLTYAAAWGISSPTLLFGRSAAQTAACQPKGPFFPLCVPAPTSL